MRFVSMLPLFLLAACNSHDGSADGIISRDGLSPRAYAGIAESETLRFTGTEPFWGGSVSGSSLVYDTPENPNGTTIKVRRFAGNNGLAFTGTLGGSPFDMAVTESACSDGMSDRTYPFTVTLTLGGALRNGCGWTDGRKFTGPQTP